MLSKQHNQIQRTKLKTRSLRWRICQCHRIARIFEDYNKMRCEKCGDDLENKLIEIIQQKINTATREELQESLNYIEEKLI